MQGKHTARLITYLNAQRSSRDRAILARLRGDRARGIATSETIRRALETYYNPPTPQPAHDVAELVGAVKAVSTTVDTLVGEVRALKTEVATMRAELRHQAVTNEALRAENVRLRVQLVALAYGNRDQKKEALASVAAMVRQHQAHKGNGAGT